MHIFINGATTHVIVVNFVMNGVAPNGVICTSFIDREGLDFPPNTHLNREQYTLYDWNVDYDQYGEDNWVLRIINSTHGLSVARVVSFNVDGYIMAG